MITHKQGTTEAAPGVSNCEGAAGAVSSGDSTGLVLPRRSANGVHRWRSARERLVGSSDSRFHSIVSARGNPDDLPVIEDDGDIVWGTQGKE